jgi:hypothetical protein
MMPIKRHSKTFLALLLSLACLHSVSIYSILEKHGGGGESEELDLTQEVSPFRKQDSEEKGILGNITVNGSDDDDDNALDNRITEYSSSENISVDEKIQETAVIIPTHLVPSHPSLDLLLNTFNSIRQYISGLHPKAPVIITVDNLLEDSPKNRGENGLLLLLNEENRHKLEMYLKALYKHFAHEENVKIVVAGKGIGLAENIKKAVDILHPKTKYMYIVQQDLPFVAKVNHTAIVKTVKEHPQLVRIVRFNNYGSVNDVYNCDEPNIVPEINAYGITLKKYKKWSDQNHFATVEHYKNDVLPATGGKVFPEARLQQLAFKNCTFYGPYYYFEANRGGPWYIHVDGTERYGDKLVERLRNGQLDMKLLSRGNLKDLERSRINTTELMELNQRMRKTGFLAQVERERDHFIVKNMI